MKYEEKRENTDESLLVLASQRMNSYKPEDTISLCDIQKGLGISDEELEKTEEVEIE